MLFNSYQFLLVFLPISLLCYFTLGHFKKYQLAKISLFAVSIVFYSYWNIYHLPLLLISVTMNYLIGFKLYPDNVEAKNYTRRWLFLGCLLNLLLLGYYKYGAFLSHVFGINAEIEKKIFSPILPLGISFFTFQQIAYLVDVYKGQKPETNFLNYATFITFFEHLVSGPLVLYNQLMPQLNDNLRKQISARNVSIGLITFLVGLGKKVLLADSLGPSVNRAFASEHSWGFLDSWFIVLCYSMQLYFDFSGYSDMAIGLSRVFNIKLPENFNSPYKSESIIEFWRRWHMSLSEFLRKYLYIPLGGNKYGTFNRYKNLLLTMLLGGIWHGAGWQFLIWGFLHGIYLIVNNAWRKFGFFLPRCISITVTFLSVMIAWVFFRAKSCDVAINVLHGMVDFSSFRASGLIYLKLDVLLKLFFILPIAFVFPNTNQLTQIFERNLNARNLNDKYLPILLGGFAYLLLLCLNDTIEFLYFEF